LVVSIEIERKFLVINDGWRPLVRGSQRVCQGYLARSSRGKIRIRRIGETAFLAVKGPRKGISRTEFEYPIAVDDAEEMLRTICVQPVLEKTRFEVVHAGLIWEIDVFTGDASGLVLAEVELKRDDQHVRLPSWVGREVTHDERYRSAAIVLRKQAVQHAIAKSEMLSLTIVNAAAE
jgi:CYTH domain-containing protein